MSQTRESRKALRHKSLRHSWGMPWPPIEDQSLQTPAQTPKTGTAECDYCKSRAIVHFASRWGPPGLFPGHYPMPQARFPGGGHREGQGARSIERSGGVMDLVSRKGLRCPRGKGEYKKGSPLLLQEAPEHRYDVAGMLLGPRGVPHPTSWASDPPVGTGSRGRTARPTPPRPAEVFPSRLPS